MSWGSNPVRVKFFSVDQNIQPPNEWARGEKRLRLRSSAALLLLLLYAFVESIRTVLVPDCIIPLLTFHLRKF
jgi:hypothetical protein